MIDLRLIQHFEAVFRHESFSQAADELHLTHSTLTKSIKSLEAAWDTLLFHRTTRTVAPTEAGKRLYPMAVDLLAFAESVKAQTVAGEPQLNIVSGPAALETVITPGILSFRETHKSTKINAETLPPTLAIEELVQRRAHILVYHSDTMSGLPHLKRLQIENIIEEPYVIVFRPGHDVLKTDRSLAAVAAFDWAIAGYDVFFQTGLPPAISDILLQNGFPKYRLLSQSACIELAKTSNILTTIPESLAARFVAEGTLASIPHPAKITFSVSVATLPDIGREPTVRAFIESLRSI